MAFQIKRFTSIVASIINAARGATSKITDYQPGSVARTLLEAPAVEVEELYHQFFLGLREAIPVATFLSFGFGKNPSARARGYVSVVAASARTDALTIPAGTTFLTASGAVYSAVADTVWAAGTDHVTVFVEASVDGLAGNTGPSTIIASPFFSGSPVTVSNLAITNGKDAESSAEQESRFAEFVAALSRGTVDACGYAAKQAVVLDVNGIIIEYVTRIGIVESAGYVRIYLYSSTGLPSGALLNDAQKRLDGWRDDVSGVITPGYRAGGVRADAIAMVERAVNLSVRVKMIPGASLTSDVIQRMNDIFSSAVVAINPGETLFLGTMGEMLLNIPSVLSVVPVSTENFICADNEALTPGTFSATPL